MRKTLLAAFLIAGIAFSANAFSQDINIERYRVKNLKVKSYYENDQGELTRWVDEELLRIDTATGRVWRWVSERDKERKVLHEYWQEMVENDLPMSKEAR